MSEEKASLNRITWLWRFRRKLQSTPTSCLSSRKRVITSMILSSKSKPKTLPFTKNLTTALSKQRKEPNRKALRLSWMSRRIQLPPLQPLNRLLRQWQLQHRLLFRLKVSRLTNQKLKKKLITFLSAPVGPDSYRLKMLWSPSFFSCSASRFAVSKEEGQPHAGCSASTWFSGRL